MKQGTVRSRPLWFGWSRRHKGKRKKKNRSTNSSTLSVNNSVTTKDDDQFSGLLLLKANTIP